MALIPWDPFRSVDEAFNRMMPSLFSRLHGDEDGGRVSFLPAADISETDKEYIIRCDLPAVRKEDVRVYADDGVITIEGERKHHSEEENERVHRVESFYGTFKRSFTLPPNANEEGIRCESKDGVLTCHIPKREPEKKKARQIKVD